MSEMWRFENALPLGYILAGMLFLLMFFVWKEWPGRHRPGFRLRLLAALIAIVSLGCILLAPAILRTLEIRRAIVCTEGCDPSLLDSLKRKYRGIGIHRYTPGESLNLPAEVRSVWLNGHGLAPFDFWQLKGRDVRYLPSVKPNGITRLQRPAHGILGDPVSIGGLYHLPQPGNRLVLKDPGGNSVDSVRLRDQTESPFKLKTYPRAVGALTYRLEEQDSSGVVLRSDPWPLRIQKPDPLRVLILNTFPTFETKYLKNFLSEKGNKILVRTQLTRGAFKFEYINRERKPLYALTGESLGDFDLIILDANTYRNLGPSSREALRKGIAEEGLGLFIQPDEGYFSLPERLSFFSFLPGENQALDIGYEDESSIEKYPYTLRETYLTEPVTLDNGKQIGAYRHLGTGKVITTPLKNSYQLLLKGKGDLYAEIWSTLIRAATAPEKATIHWESDTLFPVPNAPFIFQLRTSVPNPGPVLSNGARLPLQQDFRIPTLWRGTDYPVRVGWNQLKVDSDSTYSFSYFVYDPGDWPGIRQMQRQEANLQHFSQSEGEVGAAEGYVLITPIWFYILFLVATTWLWLEPRLFGDRSSG